MYPFRKAGEARDVGAGADLPAGFDGIAREAAGHE